MLGRIKCLVGALDQVADGFFSSAEFQNAYGSLGTRDFVATLYANALNRPADQAGLDLWSNAINAGALSRPAVLLQFSESSEHQRLVAADVGGETPGVEAPGGLPPAAAGSWARSGSDRPVCCRARLPLG